MTTLSLEDSVALADSLRKALQERYAFASGRKQELGIGPSGRPAIWAVLVELGLTSLALPEAQGGFGGSVADVQRVQRELGRGLVVSPWFDTVLASKAVLLAGSPAQQEALLPAIAGGELSLAVASADLPAFDGAGFALQARQEGSDWRISGVTEGVPHAGTVDRLLLTARLPDGGQTWFLVQAGQPEIRQRAYRLVDSSWAADLRLEGAQAERLGSLAPIEQSAAIRSLRLLAVAGQCAEALGAADAALEMSIQHLRMRKQFGQALGDYQALRHRVAEMYIALEQLRSAAELAAEAAGCADDSAEAERRSAQAQLVATDSATWILQQAIQLHGGMGMTEELAVGHYYRRMLVINALSGGASAALARLTSGEH